MIGDFNPISKPLYKRSTGAQRKKGTITPNVREEVRERSQGRCEVSVKCTGAEAVHMAHLIGRRLIEHATTAEDLLHSCLLCHRWLDMHPEGIRYKRKLKEERNESID